MAGRSKKSPEQDAQGRYRAVTPEVEQLAAAIRTAFIQSRQSYCAPGARVGGTGKSADRYYLSAAFMCRDSGESPEAFVHARLEEMVRIGAPLYPQGLVSTKVEESVQERSDSIEASVFDRYQWQIQYFQERCAAFTPAELARDEQAPFTPLFRCYIAIKHQVPDVLDRHRDSARRELASHPLAREIFADHIGLL
jgi:hypothetical protein